MTYCHPWAFGEIQDGVQEGSQIQEFPFPMGYLQYFYFRGL